MGSRDVFRTKRYREQAGWTYGRMSETTLRKTGLEWVLRKATASNLAVLERTMGAAEFRKLKETLGPEGIWGEVKARGLDGKEVIGMSLGNPSAYADYPPNKGVMECLKEVVSDGTPEAEMVVRGSAGYTHSFGYPPLVKKLKMVGFSDPRSVENDPEKFDEVRVYVTAGGSYAAELAMGPALLAPEDTIVVPDWTYIIHLGAAYYRGARIASYECREDGRPDSDSLRRVLTIDHGRVGEVQGVVFTPIGNPVGSAMTREDIIEHLNIVGDAGVKLGRPVLAIVDVAYEAFRRDGMPLDILKIAIEETLRVPVLVLDTASKGYGLCGWRVGKLAIYWPEDYFPDARSDYFDALEYRVLPTLGVAAVPLQMAFDRFFDRLKEPAIMAETEDFFGARRVRINENLVRIAEALDKIPGVYLAKYYDKGGQNGGIDPTTLSSFYILFGFTRLLERYGSGFNQAVAFGEYALETPGIPIINCVPGQSFLPQDRWASHPALIRVTGLTDAGETEAFIRAAGAFAKSLG